MGKIGYEHHGQSISFTHSYKALRGRGAPAGFLLRSCSQNMSLPLISDWLIDRFASHQLTDTEQQQPGIQGLPSHILDSILSACTDPFYIFDRKFRLLYANRASLLWIQQVLNKSEPLLLSEAIGKTGEELGLPPEVIASHEACQKKVFTTGRSRQEGFRYHEYALTPIYNLNGQVDIVVLISRDITERHQTEEILRNVIDTNPHLILVKDREGKFILVNQALANIYGTTVEDLIGKTDADFNPNPIEVQNYLQADRQVMDTLKPQIIAEETVSSVTGETRWFQTIKAPLRSPDGSADRVLVVATDITERKQAEVALCQSEAKWRSLIQNSSDVVTIVDANNQILYQSPSITKILGYHPNELVGFQGFEFVHPDDIDSVKEAFAQLLNSPTCTLSISYRFRHQNGSWRFLESTGTNLLNEPWVEGIVINSRDVTERQQAQLALQQLNEELERRVEERTRELTEANQRLEAEIIQHQKTEVALKASQQQLLAIAANVPGVVYRALLHSEGSITLPFISNGIQQLAGLTPAAAIANPQLLFDLIHPDDRAAFNQQLQAGVVNLQPLNHECRIVTADGQLKWLHYSTRYTPIGNGDAIADGVVLDISDRKRSEAALWESEQQFRAIFEQAAVGIVQTSLEGQLLQVNQTFGEILGYTPSEILGRNFVEITYAEDREVSRKYHRKMLAGEVENISLEKRYIRKDGSAIWCLFNGAVLRDGEGELKGFICVIQDISDRKQAEVALRKALAKEKELNELKSRFVAMISHEFRTPLTTILSSAELLQRYSQRFTEEKKITHLGRIQLSVEHMTQMLNDVLLLGKTEAGKFEFQPAPLDIRQFCRALVEEFQLSADSRHTIHFEECSSLSSLQGQGRYPHLDRKLLRHILSNLLSNAIKYSPKSSTVNFKLAVEDKQIIFQIEDRGIGIPEEDQCHLFESFHRAKNVGTIPGTGLGLAIVKNLVTLHSGQITLQSQVGVGTTFIVTLPLYEKG
ncbi:MAG TPA: hypothetical protein DDZ80_16975 [Cyanobacteria bacterium UBA8803]|nr:hypothetical protein [Cyanobacteria bacterium UBA8803]